MGKESAGLLLGVECSVYVLTGSSELVHVDKFFIVETIVCETQLLTLERVHLFLVRLGSEIIVFDFILIPKLIVNLRLLIINLNLTFNKTQKVN
jgi:hypothetical protein